MVSFAEACVCSALEGETKFWITLYATSSMYSFLFGGWIIFQLSKGICKRNPWGALVEPIFEA